MVSGTVPSLSPPVLPIISSQAGGSRQRFGLSQLQSGIVTVTLLTLGLQSASLSVPTYSPDLSGGQRPTLVSLTSLKCSLAVMSSKQSSVSIEMSQVESTNRKWEQFIWQKYFHKFESEDPIRSLKTVEVEKKKDKERQARNVSDRSKYNILGKLILYHSI